MNLFCIRTLGELSTDLQPLPRVPFPYRCWWEDGISQEQMGIYDYGHILHPQGMLIVKNGLIGAV